MAPDRHETYLYIEFSEEQTECVLPRAAPQMGRDQGGRHILSAGM